MDRAPHQKASTYQPMLSGPVRVASYNLPRGRHLRRLGRALADPRFALRGDWRGGLGGRGIRSPFVRVMPNDIRIARRCTKGKEQRRDGGTDDRLHGQRPFS